MDIAIIGVGNVGGALAEGWAKKDHKVNLGVRDPNKPNIQKLLQKNPNLEAKTVLKSVKDSQIILIALPIPAVVNVAKSLGNLSDKIVIDATNSVFTKPEPYSNAFEAFKEINKCNDIVKCFNTTGFENMLDPIYDGKSIDMFLAGQSEKAKETASLLAKDLGFENCYDFGGNDKVELIEQFAMSWINLALLQKEGREIAFKILRR